MQIAILGAGTMGTGIAQSAARGGDPIILQDPDAKTLRLALAHISRGLDSSVRQLKLDRSKARRAKRVFTLTTDLGDCAGADLVIEALPDTLSAKQSIIRRVEGVVRPEVVIATTTSTLSVTTVASAAQYPQRVIGLHFFPPAHVMRLVEVVRTPHTTQPILDQATALLRKIEKTPVITADEPGWIVNRIAQAYFGEAFALLDGGGLPVETIDRLMEAAGFPMGPFRLMDYVGIDKAFKITQQIYQETFQAVPYRPHPRQKRLIEAGRLGRNSDRGGFYPSVPGTHPAGKKEF